MSKVVTNWMKTVEFTPAVFEEALSVEDVQRIVRDSSKYPSPVRPAGRILSPSLLHLNEGGTTISMAKLKKIHGLKTISLPFNNNNKSVTCIDTEPGATLRELEEFAHAHDLELPYSAEIGLSTIGGTAFAITKDSTIGKSPVEGMGIGDVGSIVFAVTVVEEDGAVKEYKVMDEATGQFDPYFQTLLDSYGTRGIAVRMLVTTRPKTPVTNTMHFISMTNLSAKQVGEKLLQFRKDTVALDGNVFGLIVWKQDLLVIEERIPTANATHTFAPFSPILAPVMRTIKKSTIQNCKAPFYFKYLTPISGTSLLRFNQASRDPGNYYQSDIPKSTPKLTFSFYAFPEDSLVQTTTACLEFTAQYEAEHGFAPTGYALYFVTLSGQRPGGPYCRRDMGGGNNNDVAFSFDPTFDQPNDPAWRQFVVAFNQFVAQLGGLPALNQTLMLEENVAYGAKAVYGKPCPRFTSPWLKQFFDQADSQ